MNHPLTQAGLPIDPLSPSLAGRLPRTEWTGETNHAERIVVLLQAEGSPITRDDLMCRKVGADTTALDRAA